MRSTGSGTRLKPSLITPMWEPISSLGQPRWLLISFFLLWVVYMHIQSKCFKKAHHRWSVLSWDSLRLTSATATAAAATHVELGEWDIRSKIRRCQFGHRFTWPQHEPGNSKTSLWQYAVIQTFELTKHWQMAPCKHTPSTSKNCCYAKTLYL